MVRSAYESLVEARPGAIVQLLENSSDKLRRPSDCAVIRRLHSIVEETGSFDAVRVPSRKAALIYSGAKRKTAGQIPDLTRGRPTDIGRSPPNQLEA
jgi:hypothetical protein